MRAINLIRFLFLAPEVAKIVAWNWATSGPRPSRLRSVCSTRLLLHMSERPEENSVNDLQQEASLSKGQEELDAKLQRNITAVVDKKIRMAKAQAQIDRILTGPDAPFDAEAELKKVIAIASPVVRSLAEEELEAKENELEKDLYHAVKQQDFATAAKVKAEISKLHVDDCGAVLQANSMFYRAFSEKDMSAMESLWLKDGTSTCIHPSSNPLVGSSAVLKSWTKMFEATNKSFQRSWMEPHNIRLSVKGASTAIVTCDEHVFARRFVRGQKRQTELVNKLLATNIFRKVGGKWYMCYHHASWHAESEAAKAAIRGSAPMVGARTAVLRSKSRTQASSDEEVENGISGLLGMNNFGPLLGPSGKQEASKPGVKRIVMGNLSDLLKGNLGDILGASSGDSNEDGRAIISFNRIDDDGEESDEDDDDDDELDIVVEEDDDEGDESDNEKEAEVVMKQWSTATEKSTKKVVATSAEPKDQMRQSCISALRKLCEQGSISPKQKRSLLTDIITCSAKGEYSMVEVAYELLCGEGEDKDVAQEEFAEQCRVFAHSLSGGE